MLNLIMFNEYTVNRTSMFERLYKRIEEVNQVGRQAGIGGRGALIEMQP